ncbi:mediator of RNA polymerase II transcription subunit 20a-like [Musa acuminata AAA Group]|uniref:mediator of RNA polymerase II transcription subunit 20a-like n=1 Tax=Musa acuminata AAA Group TaxID=214697 RepID=UPI0031DD52AE
MPVKWLMHWQPNSGATMSSQILAEVCQCVEGFGSAAKEGRWRTTLTIYRPVARDPSSTATSAPVPTPGDLPRDFLGLTLHDRPGAYFFILRHHRLILQADANVQSLMDKLQSYKARVVLHFEGFQYQLGDFMLRVGKCVQSHADTLRGIMMEVEYLPLSSIDKSRQIMEDFLDIWQDAVIKKSLPGQFINVELNFADYGLQDQYTPQHTALQYATCIVQLMATVRS